MLIATHYLDKADKQKKKISPSQPRFRTHHETKSEIDLDAYSQRNIDRFGVLYDLWSCEANFVEKKKQLFDCYVEAYHHIVDVNERKKMTQVLTNS